MTSYKTKWGVEIQDNIGHFLLGANINIGDSTGLWEGYMCVYLGFKTLVIGKFL